MADCEGLALILLEMKMGKIVKGINKRVATVEDFSDNEWNNFLAVVPSQLS